MIWMILTVAEILKVFCRFCPVLFSNLFIVDKNENEILEAAEEGDLNRIKELLKIRKELVNIIDRDKYTPLHRACSTNQKEVALLLIENGADVDAKTDMGWTPLHSCCHWNSLDCANILLQHGADVNAQSEGG